MDSPGYTFLIFWHFAHGFHFQSQTLLSLKFSMISRLVHLKVLLVDEHMLMTSEINLAYSAQRISSELELKRRHCQMVLCGYIQLSFIQV